MSGEKELEATRNRHHSCGCNSRETFVIESTPVDGTNGLCACKTRPGSLLLSPTTTSTTPTAPRRSILFVTQFTRRFLLSPMLASGGDHLKSFISIQSEPVMSSDEYARHRRFWDAEMVAHQSGSAYNLRGFNFHSRQHARTWNVCVDQLPLRTFSHIFGILACPSLSWFRTRIKKSWHHLSFSFIKISKLNIAIYNALSLH